MTSSKDRQLQSFYDRLFTYVEKDKFSKAAIVCDKILKAETCSSKLIKAQETKCICLILQDKLSQALQVAETCVESSSSSTGLLCKAYILYKQKASDEALSLLTQQQGDEGMEQVGLHLKAQLFYRLGKYESAGELYEKLLQDAGKDASSELLSNYCAAKILSGDPAQALQVLKDFEGILEVKNNYELLLNVACAMVDMGEIDLALEKLDKALAMGTEFLESDDLLTPEDVAQELSAIRVQQGYALQKSKLNTEANKEKAAQVYSQVVATNPQDDTATAIAANNLLAIRGEHDLFDSYKAMRSSVTEATVEKLPVKFAERLWFNKALLLLQMQKSTECRKLLKDLMEKYPESELPHLIEASLLLREKKQAKCVELLEKLVKEQQLSSSLADQGACFVLALAQIEISQGNLDKATQILVDATNLRFNLKVVSSIVALYEARGELEKAYTYLEKLIQEAESQVDAEGLLKLVMLQGEFLLREEKFAQATEVFDALMNGKHGALNGSQRLQALANYVVASAHVDLERSESKARSLPAPVEIANIDIEALENAPELRRRSKSRPTRVATSTPVAAAAPVVRKGSPSGSIDLAAMKAKMQQTKAKKTAKRRAKRREAYLAALKEKNGPDFDPAQHMPNPERWIPKSMREEARRARKKKVVKLTGAQGAGNVSAHEASRLDVRATDQAKAASSASASASSSNRKKGKKKGRR